MRFIPPRSKKKSMAGIISAIHTRIAQIIPHMMTNNMPPNIGADQIYIPIATSVSKREIMTQDIQKNFFIYMCYVA